MQNIADSVQWVMHQSDKFGKDRPWCGNSTLDFRVIRFLSRNFCGSLWPGSIVVRALLLRLKMSQVRISAVLLSCNNHGQVVHTHVLLTKQYNLVPVTGR